MADQFKSLEIIVSGRVQRVGFRNFIFEKAVELSIKGTVKNKDDGSVLINATGTNMQLDEFIEWCQRGSPISKVNKVKVETLDNVDHSVDFRIQK